MATDPSDWFFKPLKDLDTLLRCPICYDYFSTAVVLPQCSHNYCSLCIRRFLCHKQLCPSCNEPATDADLKANRILDELVTSFTSGRSEFVALVQLWRLKAVNEATPPPTRPASREPQPGCEERRGSAKNPRRATRTRVVRKQTKHLTNTPEESGLGVEPAREIPRVKGRSGRGYHDQAPSREMEFSVDEFIVPKPPPIDNGEFDFEDDFSERGVAATPPLPTSQSNFTLVATPTLNTMPICNNVSRLDATPTLNATPTIQRSLSCTREGRPNRRLLKFEAVAAKEERKEEKEEERMEEISVSMAEGGTEMGGSVECRGKGSCDGAVLLPAGREGQEGVTQEESARENSDGHSLSAGNGRSEAVDSTLVECPVCTSKVKASLINAHLDRCLNDPGQSISPPTPPLSSQPLLSSRTENQAVPPKMSGMPLQYQRSKPLPRLPKIVFNIMNDRTLKKKLKEYHLSTHGSRKTLISRLEEFTLQYKAQQDTLCPKTVREIAQAVDNVERDRESARRHAPLQATPTMAAVEAGISANRRNASVEEIERERKSYEQKHSSHFAALIAGLRDRSNKQETTEEEAGGVKGQVGGVKDESSEVNDNSEVLDQEWWDRDDEGAWLLGGEGSAPEDEEEEVVSEKRTVATSVIPESPATSHCATPMKKGHLSSANLTPSRSPFKFRYLDSPSHFSTPSPSSSSTGNRPSPSILRHNSNDLCHSPKRAKLDSPVAMDQHLTPVARQQRSTRVQTRRNLRPKS